jgi:hypothetical protein
MHPFAECTFERFWIFDTSIIHLKEVEAVKRKAKFLFWQKVNPLKEKKNRKTPENYSYKRLAIGYNNYISEGTCV